MRIQPAAMPAIQEINFGQKRPTTKIPGSLNVKPKHKGPSKFSICLMSVISLLACGTWLYRQTYQYKFQTLFKQYQKDCSEYTIDSTCSHQDSINYRQKLDSLTIDFLKKITELNAASKTNENEKTADTAYININK